MDKYAIYEEPSRREVLLKGGLALGIMTWAVAIGYNDKITIERACRTIREDYFASHWSLQSLLAEIEKFNRKEAVSITLGDEQFTIEQMDNAIINLCGQLDLKIKHSSEEYLKALKPDLDSLYEMGRISSKYNSLDNRFGQEKMSNLERAKRFTAMVMAVGSKLKEVRIDGKPSVMLTEYADKMLSLRLGDERYNANQHAIVSR